MVLSLFNVRIQLTGVNNIMESSGPENIEINYQRFIETLNTSSETGKVNKTGLYRLALSDEDKQMRDMFKQWMIDEGLEVRVDDIGNMYGRREGKEDKSPVLIGSHLDTQPYGGRFDGVLGVLLSLEIIKTLNDYNIETTRPIEIVNFTNEEGARFEPPMMASGTLSGNFSKEYVYSRKDQNGFLFENELERIGYRGTEENRIKDIHSFLEVHIEQGPKLEEQNTEIGVVTGIQGTDWLEIVIEGKSNHAGTTPMNHRKDPLMAAAEFIKNIEQKAIDDSLVLTIGKFETAPGAVNVIPGKVKFSLDIRSEEGARRESFIEYLKEELNNLSGERNVSTEINHLWHSPTVHFNRGVLDTIESNNEKLGLTTMHLMSGAGHDARYISEIAPSAMIFMPSIDGISHDISELTLDEDIFKCGTLFLEVVRELADKESWWNGHAY